MWVIDYNTLKIKINSYSRALTRPTATQIAIFIGTLLGDGYLFINPDGGKNARFGHLQAAQKAIYSCHIFMKLWTFCESVPLYRARFRIGGIRHSVTIQTRVYPFLTDLYYEFYFNKIKRIPFEVMLINFDAEALSYWIIDDGSKKTGGGLYLHTESYTWIEVYQLAGLFHYLFDLECTVHKASKEGKPILLIKKRSINTLRQHVYPYILSSFMIFRFKTFLIILLNYYIFLVVYIFKYL